MFFVFENQEEENKFLYLYYKYNKLLYKYVYDILKNKADTEDVLQMTYFKLSKNMGKIMNSNDRKCVNYLITISVNTAISIYNERKNKGSNLSYDEVFENVISDGFGDAYRHFEYSRLLDKIEALDEELRLPLILKFVYGYSIKEISKELNISEANVGVRIFRAKNKLKKSLAE